MLPLVYLVFVFNGTIQFKKRTPSIFLIDRLTTETAWSENLPQPLFGKEGGVFLPLGDRKDFRRRNVYRIKSV